MGMGFPEMTGVRRLVTYTTVVITSLAVAGIPVEARTLVDLPAMALPSAQATLPTTSPTTSSPTTSPPVLASGDVLVPDAPIDLDAVAERLPGATAAAADRGAQVTMVLLDRLTGATVTSGADEPIATASVVKLFIADDILFRAAAGEFTLSPDDRATLDVMLRSSDDNAGESLWSRFGESDIVDRVAARYGLSATSSIPGDAWWNTMTTMSDLAHYYSALADGSGGLDEASSSILVGDLASFTDFGADGYDQRFGIPDALQPAIEVAVKQGWMCCVDSSWIHLSTGYLGADHRFVLTVGSSEISRGWANATSGQARATVTQFLTALFPAGSIAPRPGPRLF